MLNEFPVHLKRTAGTNSNQCAVTSIAVRREVTIRTSESTVKSHDVSYFSGNRVDQNHKTCLVYVRYVQTQSSRTMIQPGFLSNQVENAFGGIENLDYGPQGLGLGVRSQHKPDHRPRWGALGGPTGDAFNGLDVCRES